MLRMNLTDKVPNVEDESNMTGTFSRVTHYNVNKKFEKSVAMKFSVIRL